MDINANNENYSIIKRWSILYKDSCKTVTRVSVPFTEGHYYGKDERPNTELADNSIFINGSPSDSPVRADVVPLW